jgi:ABC-type branched-subunit amino acid transport system substrate-binding protein
VGTALAMFAVVSVLTGCLHRFDSRADPIPSATDPNVEREYRDARARYDAGDAAGAAERYATFVANHPNDALVRSAKIGEARSRMALGQLDKAKEVLSPVARTDETLDLRAEPVVARARFLLGQVLVRAGAYEQGRALLRGFKDLGVTSEDQAELYANFAAAAIGLGEPAEALVELDHFYGAARPAERAYILSKAAEAAAKLPAPELDRLWAGPRDVVLTAFVGGRLAEEHRRAGDTAGADSLSNEASSARRKLGLETRGAAASRRLTAAIGCVLPLSGKLKSLGDRALRGILLGAELVGAAGGQGELAVEVRDTASDPQRVRAAVDELAQAGVLAVVGPPDRASAVEAASAAAALGLPLFSLGPDEGRASSTIFHLARPRVEAARAVARLMADAHLQRVAVLGPDGASGRELARAFDDEARARGLHIVAELHFADNATSFAREVRQIDGARPQALFVPATAAQLDLIAPQLAASGLSAMANVKTTGHEVRLYATADGLGARNLSRSGKYMQGATVLPPYWAEPADPRAAAFLDRYHEAYGEEPSVLDALAFDAVRAVRVVYSQTGLPGAWSDVANALHTLDAGGLTGPLGFGPEGQRAGQAQAWVVEGESLKPRP